MPAPSLPASLVMNLYVCVNWPLKYKLHRQLVVDPIESSVNVMSTVIQSNMVEITSY